MSFEINKPKVAEWSRKWANSFGSINDDPASMRTLIYLTLLERQDEMTSYQDIAKELESRGMVEGEIDDFSPLRNGMAQVVSALQTHSLYKIEHQKNKKESSYRLKKRSQLGVKNQPAGHGKIVKVLDDPELMPSTEFVAEKLMRDRRMPFYGIYLPMRAASRWVLYSEREAKQRSKYEGEQCERLLGEWLSKYRGKEISLIGLGVGEGIGEIEIITRLLDEKYGFSRVHYCAIDTNVHLLMDHAERLRDKFKEQIGTNRLVCGVICGNFLENFSKLIQRLRAEFVENGQFADSESGFLPNTGTVVSILGNVVGNLEQRASEWSYFNPILEELRGYDLAFLLGVSVQQTEQKKKGTEVVQETYQKELEDLLLATPRYLTHELSMLKTQKPEDSTAEDEFILPEVKTEADNAAKEKRWPEVIQLDYEGDGLMRGTHVKGKIYEFFYNTQWDLSMTLDGEELRIPAGTSLLLYNIIKFDKDTLIDFLVSLKGLFQVGHEPELGTINSGNEERSYVMIALTNKDPGLKNHAG